MHCLLAEIIRRLTGPFAYVAAGGTGMAARCAPGAKAMPILAAHHHHCTWMADLQIIFHAEAAPMLAGAFSIGTQTEPPHHNWRFGLQHFHRDVAQERYRE